MTRALVKYKDWDAGILSETDNGYTFEYFDAYLSSPGAHAVSLTLPLTNEVYHSKVLFPFFDGLIPEGWLLEIALRSSDISELDRFSLLLLCCKDCIGAISVIPLITEQDV